MLLDFIKTLIVVILLLCGVQVLLLVVPTARVFILSGFFAVGIWAVFCEPNRLVVKSRRVMLSDWPSECNGMKIAVLGCLHAGAPFVDTKKLRRIVKLTNEQHADSVFLLGDFVGTFVLFGRSIAPELVAQELHALEAPQGKFAVLGNHDLWHGKERIARALQSSGIILLDNTIVGMKHTSGVEIRLAGVAFEGDQIQAVATTFHSEVSSKATIALVHSPDVFPMMPSYVMLTCASHTHGGQIRLPFIGALLVPCKTGTRYASGQFKEGGRQMIVTNGIGTSMLPARLFCPPEILVLTLYRANSSSKEPDCQVA